MALRLIEIYLPDVSWEDVASLLDEQKTLSQWRAGADRDALHLRVLVESCNAAPLLDAFEKRFKETDGFRMVVLPVEASIPRPEPEQKESDQAEAPPESPAAGRNDSRVVREELYEDITAHLGSSTTYIALVALSSVVAGVGILRDNTAIIVGAMVIAPLLGPNVALALATTLADWSLASRALRALGIGVAAAFAISVGWGLAMEVVVGSPAMASSTIVGPGDIVLALASGSAGVLAFTAGAPAALVGVMVAVALLPPLVTCGLLLGSGHLQPAQGALLVFLTNVICVNLAGVVTFLIQGVRPLTWWETQRAKKAVRSAILVWAVLLLALIAVILLARD